MNTKKFVRQHRQLSKKFEYHAKLMEVADLQLAENPDPIEEDLYYTIVDDYYRAKHALETFENKTNRLVALHRFTALKK